MPNYGIKNGRAKLTPAKVRAIRKACAKGATHLSQAKKHGVTESVVCKAVNRVTWEAVK